MIKVLLGSIYSFDIPIDLSTIEFNKVAIEGFYEIGAFYNATLSSFSITATKFYFSDVVSSNYLNKEIMFICYLDETFINKYVGYGILRDEGNIIGSINKNLVIENITSMCFKD